MNKAQKLIDLCNEHGDGEVGSATSPMSAKGVLGGDKSGHKHVTMPGAIAVKDHGWEDHWAEHGECPPGWSRVGDQCVKDEPKE
jgi:hypothetical protein